MQDIDLANAVIAMDIGTGGKAQRHVVRVFPVGDRRANAYDLTLGACEACWRDNPEHRIGLLAERLLTLIQGFGVDPNRIDRALNVIPEYRVWRGLDPMQAA